MSHLRPCIRCHHVKEIHTVIVIPHGRIFQNISFPIWKLTNAHGGGWHGNSSVAGRGRAPRQLREFPPPHTPTESLTTSWKAGEQRSCSHMTHTFSHTLTPSATTWYSPPSRGGTCSPHATHGRPSLVHLRPLFFISQTKFTFNFQSLMEVAEYFFSSDS